MQKVLSFKSCKFTLFFLSTTALIWRCTQLCLFCVCKKIYFHVTVSPLMFSFGSLHQEL